MIQDIEPATVVIDAYCHRRVPTRFLMFEPMLSVEPYEFCSLLLTHRNRLSRSISI